MATSPAQFPRAVRVAPEPLGWHLRPSYVDHRAIAGAVASGSVGVYGVVFDPVYRARHSELRDLMAERNFDAILDPRTQELGATGGFNRRLSTLSWALDRPHRPEDFGDVGARRVADQVAQFVQEECYSAVLAPTHYIQSANSPWLDVDARLTVLLRQYLDRAGAGNVPILYSLAVSYDVFRSADERGATIERLADLPVDEYLPKWRADARCGAQSRQWSGGVPFAPGTVGWGHVGWIARTQRTRVRGGGRNLPRRDPERSVQRQFIDAGREGRKEGIHVADKDLCGPFGRSSDERRGNSVLCGAQCEVTIRLQGEGLLPEELEGHVGQSGSAQSGTAFVGGAAAQQRSRAAPRTTLPGRNSPARDGRGRVLGVTVVRWAGAPGEADEREQKVPGASSRRPGKIC